MTTTDEPRDTERTPPTDAPDTERTDTAAFSGEAGASLELGKEEQAARQAGDEGAPETPDNEGANDDDATPAVPAPEPAEDDE